MEEIWDELQTINAHSAVISMVGGIVFGAGLLDLRGKLIGHIPSETYWGYITYIVGVMALFYVTFPLAQGIIDILTRGSAVGVISITFYYVIFVAAFVLFAFLHYKILHKGV